MSTVVEPIQVPQRVALGDLPQPCGPYMLVRMLPLSDKISKNSLIHMPDSRKKDEESASPLAEVVIVGPECFLRKDLFPAGARCKEGDVILMAPYSGIRFLAGEDVEAEEYRLIHDGIVSAVVPRPEIVRRGL